MEPKPKHHVVGSSSQSYPQMFRIDHGWAIQNFLELKTLIEVEFKATTEENEELRFKAKMKPMSGPFMDQIGLYIETLTEKKSCPFSIGFAIFDAFNKPQITKWIDTITKSHRHKEGWGFHDFCHRSEIVDNPSQMLRGGSLCVYIKISMVAKVLSHTWYEDEGSSQSPNNSSIVKDLKDAFKTMDHPDLKLCCGESVFPCHKFILTARSDVFRAMFVHDTKESKENQVIIHDASPKALGQFLKYMYTDTLDDKSYSTAMELLSLAEKYNMQALFAQCTDLLGKHMSVENVSEIARIGQLFNKSSLKKKAIRFISQNGNQVTKTDGWKRLLKEAPDICSEIVCRLSSQATKIL